MAQGLFLVFEGVDGAGSTTQTRILCDFLKRSGHPAIATKEPSEKRIGQLIRSNLRSSVSHSAIDALLFAADRLDHLETIVKPALARNQHVICDRYLESTFAYQSAEGMEFEWLEAVNRFAIKPDHVIILDIDPAISLPRKHVNVRERFETVEFLKRVRQNFKSRAATQGFEVIDADQPVTQVHEAVKKIVLPLIEAKK